MTEYSETRAPEDDAEGRVLAALANGNIYVFVVAEVDEDGEINLRLASANGVETIKAVLKKTLAALP